VSSLTSFFWNSNVIDTEWASRILGELKEMGLLLLSNRWWFRKQSSLVRLSPVTDEYSHDLMHQKNATVRRSATVEEVVDVADDRDACR
jgi:hypothetical protein